MIAYVLINTEVGCTSEILEVVKTIPNIIETHSVYGEYDIVAKLKTESLNALSQTISGKIRRLNNVNSTLTLIAIEEPIHKLSEDEPSYQENNGERFTIK